MNERMLELYRQAWVPYTSIDPSNNMPYETTRFSADKFSELIIKEALGDLKERICLRYQGDQKDRDIAYGMEIVYFDIVDKFGVK